MRVFVLHFSSNNRFYKVFDSLEAIDEHFKGMNYTIDNYGDDEISIEIDDQYGIHMYFGYNTTMIMKEESK